MRQPACMLSAIVVASVATVLFTAGEARAQDTQGAPPAVAPAEGAAPGAGAVPRRDDDEDEGGRLRIGFNINGGFGTTSGLSGPVFGGTFRVGYQLNRLLGIYGNITPFVWAASSSNALPGGLSVGATAGVQSSPMLSLTPIDLVEVAAGPSVDYLGSAVSGPTTTAASSIFFGVHGRVALHLGGRNPETGRRKGFTIGGDVHPTFSSGSAFTTFTLGLGMDWY